MTDLKKKLGARIQEIRKSKKITQEKLAELIDIETPNLSNIERGKKFMTADTLEKIINTLGVKEKELFDFEHIMPRDELKQKIIFELENMSG
ncbi:helix-turn-helix transcriptional regulator, partial [bacterium]|nr:helix-turn-helix transcriptional regulator [bacterium]